MCEDDPPLEEPMCVQWCLNDVLIYEEREEEVEEEEEKIDDVETGLESLVDKYGMQKVLDTVARMSQKGSNSEATKIIEEEISETKVN
jgi:benzoyl-CoA reductase subunit BamC